MQQHRLAIVRSQVKMVHLKSTVLVGMAAAPSAYAWGSLGHTTVAYIAQNLVSQDTKKFAQRILNDTSASYLANVATWVYTVYFNPARMIADIPFRLTATATPTKESSVLHYITSMPWTAHPSSAMSTTSATARKKAASYLPSPTIPLARLPNPLASLNSRRH